MDFSEKWGTDVDEAVKLALVDLKLTIDEVDVTVLEEPSRGFFGIGSRLAKVRVEKKKPARSEDKKEKTTEFDKQEKKQVRNDNIKKTAKTAKTADEEAFTKASDNNNKKASEPNIGNSIISEATKADGPLEEANDHPAVVFLQNVIKNMGIQLDISAKANNSCVYVTIEGKDAGTIIGKRGQTLDAIQYLTSLAVNKEKDKYVRVIVDAENYRMKREKTLEKLAVRLGDKVVKTGRNVRLEPMNPYERKVIHSTLQSNQKVVTLSEGEEPYRRVIIKLK